MSSMSEWEVTGTPADAAADDRLFFTEHEWDTIEAATARIIPTDQDLGAREARVVRFIDRYLSGIDHVFASADGNGFLEISGKNADAWRARMSDMQETYRQGIRRLDELARQQGSAEFKRLTEDQQDTVLELLSGFPKPRRMRLEPQAAEPSAVRGRLEQGEELEPIGYGTIQIWMFDEGLEFFQALTAHTRQGFYCDPVYGGNAGRAGWNLVGFPGPRSLEDTMDGTYSLREYFVRDYDWTDLIPHLKDVGP